MLKRLGWLVLGAWLPMGAAAYQVSPSKWPGNVKGSVRLKGTWTPNAPVAMERDLAACGKELPDDRVLATSDGRVQDVVVFLEGVEAGKDFPRRVVLQDLKNCRVAPAQLSLGLGDDLSLGTVDSVMHQVQLRVEDRDHKALRQPMHLAIPPQAQRVRVKAQQAGWFQLQGVGAHPWMKAATAVFDHPYHLVTGSDGAFDLKEVPAGKYTLHAWHPVLGHVSKPVEVVAGYTARLDLELEAPSPGAVAPAPEAVPPAP